MVTSANTGVIAHGSASTDSHTMVDGYKAGMHLVGRGTGRLGVGSVTQTQEATIEELVYDASGQGAEYAFSGVRMNMIPKEGSNATRVETIAYGSRETFESNNLGDLQDAPYNFQYAPQEFFFDFNPVIGGPIKENKLWYFALGRAAIAATRRILDTYFKPDSPSTPEKCRNRPPDDLCQADTGAKLNLSETVRVTHQATNKHKLRYSFDNTRARQPARQLHHRRGEAFAGSGVAAAALSDLVRAGAMDGAASRTACCSRRATRISAATFA